MNTSKMIRLSDRARALVEQFHKGEQSRAIEAAVKLAFGTDAEKEMAKMSIKIIFAVLEAENVDG